ncbi:protein still life, isoform SIF type 1-like isoform X3 [Stegodyphus dumicola]|uniref:protein still life, isoform SIF type 1-like isoform X3 n=1 Tax=Stegodyphus dumicola TaxID=202533 RepID=UPI0015AEF0AA|nr:protein still life, isoform SIF type 1-like isoform X3 [Stegodyphus dumicola]
MGNKLSCSCAPLIRKAYRYEDSPWQNARRRDGHLLRLWAEVFHVSAASGAVKWQQVSEDLVPVNITCIQDTPDCVFHITAYNSQVEKILDVRLVQPGTRLGPASECFVYWKDPATGDTWGLNFTSPIDAKQFRECCSPSFKFSRKASSSYSLKLEPPKQQKTKGKRKPQSTPSSPSRSRELQCTCMTAENLHRARNGRVRYTGAATLPRVQPRSVDDYKISYDNRSRVQTHASTSSVYDNVGAASLRRGVTTASVHGHKFSRLDQNISSTSTTSATTTSTTSANTTVKTSLQDRISDVGSSDRHQQDRMGNRSDQARQLYAQSTRKEQAKSIDCSLMAERRERPRTEELQPQSRNKSKSSDNVFEQSKVDVPGLSLDSNTLKRMLHPLPFNSTHSSPEGESESVLTERLVRKLKENETHEIPQSYLDILRSRHYRSETGRRRSLERSLCLDMTDVDQSPPSDHFLYDNYVYATTPSSSNENSDAGGQCVSSDEGPGHHAPTHTPSSPTNRLLLEYEMHLRNALARGLDAESYSLHTFEALLTQSMENVGSKCNTLPLPPFSRHPVVSMEGLSAGSSFEFNPPASVPQQPSIESTDSRIYLTSSEMSDDDRLSLTTALSEEEDGEARNSPYRARSGSAAASFNCTGTVRKAGFLSVKKWLLRKKQQVELARKRGWKGYWVCLKGTTLLFYPCDNRDNRAIDSAPKHLIIVDGAIMQPIPEHPKRDYIFCLSTAFGDAYLFQAPCHVELENWINSIHCACAAAFARHRGKTGTLHLLQEEIFRLEKEIESDFKMKHMAELQLTVVADADSRETLTNQISQWEENMERLHCEQFRLRCYMSSLQNGELPNPKSLLTHVSKATKATLNKLGVFTVSSFHAYICARSPSLLTNLLSGRGATKRRSLSRSNSGRRSLSLTTTSSCSLDLPSMPERSIKIQIPDNQTVSTTSLNVRDNMSVEEVLWSACAKKQLSPNDHFLRAKKRKDVDEYFVPPRTEVIENLINQYEVLEVCPKVLYQVELGRQSLEQLFGFSVEAELVENVDHQDELCVYVSRVEEGSVAYQQGLMKGDEIMVINGAIVSDLDMMYIESILQEEQSLCMMMRSSRTEPPDLASAMRTTTDDYIESLVCPPPPGDSVISEDMIGKLIVPSPIWCKEGGTLLKTAQSSSIERSPETSGRPTPSPVPNADTSALSVDQIDSILKVIEDSCKKTADTVTEYCRAPLERRSSSIGGASSTGSSGSASIPFIPSRQLSDGEKLRKVIMELIDTERTYVKHLNSLLEHYLEPMKKETFLSNAEINALFGNIQEIVQFQRVFLQSLEEAISAEPDFAKFELPSQFKNVLFALGNSFLYYADQFKLYSSFCASHSKAQKVLHPGEGNAALVEFLQSRNPRGQHSFSLESYLIKPIQRILKYPLLLQQLKHLTDPTSEEHQHLAEALKGMERVAEHINEMQRIHEEYGAIFDHLHRQHLKSSKQHVDLSPGELLFYAGVEWLNISEFLGKIKKGLELYAMCFVFKTAVVFLCKEKIRQKKKLMGSSSKNSTSEVEIIRYQVLIPVTEVQVRSSTLKDGDSLFLWELIHLKSQLQRRSEKVYQLSNSAAELRNSFLRTIRQIIRESVRNMTVPATKSSGAREKSPHSKKVDGQSMTRTLSTKKRSARHSQRHSAGHFDRDYTTETYDNVDPNFRTRSRTVADGMDDMSSSVRDLRDSRGHSPSTLDSEKSERSDRSDKSDKSDKSEKSDKSHDGSSSGGSGKLKPGNLGTPRALSLSATSSLSNSSMGSSSAKLIQSSNPPSNYHPQTVQASSPIWKPRENSFDKASTLPASYKGKDSETKQYFVYDEYGAPLYVIPPTVPKKDQPPASMSSKQSDC